MQQPPHQAQIDEEFRQLCRVLGINRRNLLALLKKHWVDQMLQQHYASLIIAEARQTLSPKRKTRKEKRKNATWTP